MRSHGATDAGAVHTQGLALKRVIEARIRANLEPLTFGMLFYPFSCRHPRKGPLMISASRVAIVQSTWQRILPIQNEAARMFYERLFELDPALKALFPADLRDQGRKLTTMITVAVKGLTQLESIVPAVRELGRRHVTYGVKEADYDTAAEALLWTLDQVLGDDFTPEVSAAWAEVYALLATTMQQAAANQGA